MSVSPHNIACQERACLTTVGRWGLESRNGFRVLSRQKTAFSIHPVVVIPFLKPKQTLRFGSMRMIALAIAVMAIVVMVGCRTSAPIHVWQPPALASVKNQTLVLMKIEGFPELAASIRETMLSTNGDRSRSSRLNLIVPEQLSTPSSIRLVSGHDSGHDSATDPISNLNSRSSDLAVASAARDAGVQHLLRGEIIQATGHENSVERLGMVWQLVGLSADSRPTGIPVSVDQALIEREYPDLMLVTDPHERLHRAMVRKTFSLLTATVQRQSVTLARPAPTLGRGRIRRGNDLASKGNWPAAEELWVEAIERHPGQTAGWINASIAAAARQDFSQAKQRAVRAIRLSALAPAYRSLAEQTLVWIELRQRDYHAAFDLPDPPEGWRITQFQDDLGRE